MLSVHRTWTNPGPKSDLCVVERVWVWSVTHLFAGHCVCTKATLREKTAISHNSKRSTDILPRFLIWINASTERHHTLISFFLFLIDHTSDDQTNVIFYTTKTTPITTTCSFGMINKCIKRAKTFHSHSQNCFNSTTERFLYMYCPSQITPQDLH